MEIEEKALSVYEIFERRLHELGELAGTTSDPEMLSKIYAEAKIIADILKGMKETEQEEFINRLKAKVEVERLKIDSDKNRNEKRKIRIMFIIAILFLVGGIGLTVFSYVAEEAFQKNPGMHRFADSIISFLTKLIKV